MGVKFEPKSLVRFTEFAVRLTSPAEFVMLIASILANYALLPRREGLCVLMMADD